MTEEEARDWIVDRYGADGLARCCHFIRLLKEEGGKQNLVSAGSWSVIWARHIVDSAQLALLSQIPRRGAWYDVGTGAGFPGVVIALLEKRDLTLIEPRRRRAEFLRAAVLELGLTANVLAQKVERIAGAAAVISARAVAGLDSIFTAALHLADENTVWVMPKGQHAHSELELAKRKWQGTFHVEQSITDPDAKIVVATGLRLR